MTMVNNCLDDTFQCLMMLDEFMFDDNLAHDPEKVILKIDPPSAQRSKPDLNIPLNPGWPIGILIMA